MSMRKFVACLMSFVAALVVGAAMAQPAPVITPKEHQRGAEQTFLTFPEWYLVHSPAEYAVFVRENNPDGFPFWGHIGQFCRATARCIRRAGTTTRPTSAIT